MPPPPPAPPPPPSITAAVKSAPPGSGGGDRSALLTSIQLGCILKRVPTNDRSSPLPGGRSSSGQGSKMSREASISAVLMSRQAAPTSTGAKSTAASASVTAPVTTGGSTKATAMIGAGEQRPASLLAGEHRSGSLLAGDGQRPGSLLDGASTGQPTRTTGLAPPSSDESGTHSLPGSPQPMIRRMTSRGSISSVSSTSTRRQAPAIPASAAKVIQVTGGSASVGRAVTTRRSRTNLKPTAPPPPPPTSSSTAAAAHVMRAQSMRVCGRVDSSAGVANADGRPSSSLRHQHSMSGAATVRSAPAPPPPPPSTAGRRIQHPSKPPPPPPPPASVTNKVQQPPPRQITASAAPPPPAPPIRNSSLTSAVSNQTASFGQTGSVDMVDSPAATQTNIASTVSVAAAQNEFGSRFSSQFRPMSHLPPPDRFTNCMKLYSSKTQLTSTRRPPAPPPPLSQSVQ